jgi:hypothetical protein
VTETVRPALPFLKRNIQVLKLPERIVALSTPVLRQASAAG